jgi:hypothetical protein
MNQNNADPNESERIGRTEINRYTYSKAEFERISHVVVVVAVVVVVFLDYIILYRKL